MVTVQREVERKFQVSDGFEVPDLTGLPGVDHVQDGGETLLDATYYDTPALALARTRMTLRRREGGADAGWHLKTTALAGPGRSEIGLPLQAGEPGHVPPALADLVTAVVRRAPLTPVARVVNRRRTRSLRAADGTLLAALTDDRGEATDLRADLRRTFRELEVELGPGLADDEAGAALMAAVTARLAAAGAGFADQTPKLVRTLGADANGAPAVPPPPDWVALDAPAGDLAAADLAAHVHALLAYELPTRLDVPDAVHKMRVSARRLRSALRTFGPLLDEQRVAGLEPELVWLGEVLGGPRDAEVIRDRLVALVDGLASSDLSGPVRDRFVATLDRRYEQARAAMLEAMAGQRYLDVLDAAVDFATEPPLRGRADEPVADIAPGLARKAWKRLARRVQAAAQAPPEDRDVLLHAARKAAKQARYAAEACRRAYGEAAEDLAAQAEAVQEILGEHQDSVVTAQLLRDLAEQAHQHGEDTVTYGVLIGHEEERALAAETRFAQVWHHASAKKHRAWLHRDGT